MSSKESFASKLASGTAAASKMAKWWPKHCHASAELLSACAEGREGAQDLEKMMIEIAKEWEDSVAVAKGRRAGSDVGLAQCRANGDDTHVCRREPVEPTEWVQSDAGDLYAGHQTGSNA